MLKTDQVHVIRHKVLVDGCSRRQWKRQRPEVFVSLTYRLGDSAEVDFVEVVNVDGAPDLSRTTSRAGSTRRIHRRNRARFAATSGRSTSLGRGRCFGTYPRRPTARTMLERLTRAPAILNGRHLRHVVAGISGAAEI
jgi:hypothetical protein